MRIVLSMLLLMSLSCFAQEGKKEGKKGPPPAPKNLKVLEPDQVRGAMAAFRVALNVQCSFCHVQGDFASDEKPEKLMARKMITMTHDLNHANFPDGKQHVTCYTCHRGAQEPATAPPPAPPAN